MSVWRPHTTGILIGGVVLILIALVTVYVLNNFRATTDVRLGSGVFSARVAKTDAERQKGLSGVEKLDASEGLLMVFDKSDIYGIWMKDMKIPIDVIWLDSEKKVVHIVMDAQPELGDSKTFNSKQPAKYVFEVPAGTVKGAAIKIGDKATFNVEGAK